MKATPSGSHSMKDSGTAIQNAAAQVRELLIAEAARRLELPAEQLKTDNGAVIAPDGRKLGYGDLVAGDMLHVQAQPKSKLKDPATYQGHGPAGPARRHSGQGHRRCGLCAGHAAARHGACPRRAAAELRRGTDRAAIPPRSRNCPASSRSCATAISSPSSPRRNSRRSRRCARSRAPRNGGRPRACRSRTICRTC